MAAVEKKRFDDPDETRTFKDHGKIDVVNVSSRTVGRAEFLPGWQWTKDVKPIADTDLCETSHLVYGVAGRMHIRMSTGEEHEVEQGDLVAIPPGHDAWVAAGDEPCVVLDFGEISKYAQR